MSNRQKLSKFMKIRGQYCVQRGNQGGYFCLMGKYPHGWQNGYPDLYRTIHRRELPGKTRKLSLQGQFGHYYYICSPNPSTIRLHSHVNRINPKDLEQNSQQVMSFACLFLWNCCCMGNFRHNLPDLSGYYFLY